MLYSIRNAFCFFTLSMCALIANAQILIGQTAGYSGIVAAGVKETAEGAMLYFRAVNAKGGINGQNIELVMLDDKFDPKLAYENARILIEEKKVLALFLTRGSPHTEAILPLLEKNNITLVAPSTGAMMLHQPVKKYVFNVRTTYQYEAEKAIQYLKISGIKRIALVVTDDSFGEDAVIGALKGLKDAGLSAVANEKFDRNKRDFSQIVPKVMAADAQAVVMIASGSAVVTGIEALRAAGSKAQFVTLSNNASSGFVQSLGNNARGMVVAQVFPNERSVSYGFIKEAQLLAHNNPAGSTELTPAMLEGFAAAKVMVEALRRAGAGPMTRAKIQTALENMKEYDLGGLKVGYGPNDHTGLTFADLSVVGPDGKFRR
jgi:branched-chain amino acid transport system substrate-binding protein